MFIQEVSSGRIKLRPFLESDINFWLDWRVDPEVLKYLPEPHEKVTRESEEAFFEESESSTNEIHAAVLDSSSDELIGTISLTDINQHHGTAELGIIFGNRSFWGRGYATEVIKFFLTEAQKQLKLRRILAEFETENIAMRKALESNGFKLETLSEHSRIKKNATISTYRYFKLI